MSSRSEILGKIKSLKLVEKPLPETPAFAVSQNLEESFVRSILSNKGEIWTIQELEGKIHSGTFSKVYSKVSEFESFSNQELPSDPHEFADLNLAILRGQFGVAENGAIWLEDADLGLRAVPFITEHLAILLDRNQLVGNMHEAYQKVGMAESGFGLFIAGPSKTADIEQSLVIGAHGAKSLLLVLV